MFAQLIIAKGAGSDGLEPLEQWMDEVRPGAIGWLGSTAGLTPDGDLVVLARFASEEEARRNSDRPEQSAWWAQAQKRFGSSVRFYDGTDVATILDGGSDTAGFVQVIVTHPSEPMTASEIADHASTWVRGHRPDVIGGLAAVTDDGTVFEVVYFTSEEEARIGESKELPADLRAELEEYNARFGEPTYYDLTSPRLLS